MTESRLAGVSLRLVETIEDAYELKRWLGERHDGPLGLDTESGGLSAYHHRLRLVQVGDKRTGWAIPWGRWGGVALEVLNAWEGPWVAHNSVFDYQFLSRRAGFDIPWHRLDDTLTMGRLEDPTRANGLKPLGNRLVDRSASAGQRALEDGMSEHKWTWDTVPIDFPPYWCVPKTTEILTTRGWVTWDQLRIGDDTLGYENGRNVWTRVTKVNTPGIAETVRLGNKHWSTICTPDHRWVMQKGVNKRIQTLPLRGGWKNKETTKLVLSAPATGGDSPLTPDEAAVLAWILSDGTIYWQRPDTWSSPICSIIQKPGIYADKIRALLKRVGAYASERIVEPSGCLSFYLSAPYVTELWCMAGLRTGTFTDLVLELSEGARAAWCEAWLDAEGTKGRLIVSQKDGPKAEALALTLYMEGYAVDIQQTRQDVHDFHYTKRWPTPQKTKITSNGLMDVWCPTTENGTWTARDADGNIFLTGNCYSALDPIITAHLHEVLSGRIDTLCPEAYDLERAANRICTGMMMKGMLVDVPYVEKAIFDFSTKANQIREWLSRVHGITSAKSGGQIRRAMEKCGQEVVFWTDKGAPQFDKTALLFYETSGVNPAVRQIVKYIRAVRHLEDLTSRYLANFLEQRDPFDIIHCNINVMGARTGRMSVSGPALQQLPRDDKVIRGSFVPRPGHVFVTCDLDQVEARFAAHFSGDEGLIAAFYGADHGGGDFFCGVASGIFGEPITKGDNRRQLTKNTVYGSIYGAGAEKMAETAGISVDQMRPVKEAFDARFPGLKRMSNDIIREAQMHDRPTTFTALGRPLIADDGREHTQLPNAKIQGSAAEYMKMCLIRADSAGLGEFFVLPIHDEILMEVPADKAEWAARTLEEAMTDRTSYKVPMTAGATILVERWAK